VNGNLLNAQAKGDYRTKKSGLWTDTSSWETYNGSSWASATKFPTAADKKIIILADTITLQDTTLEIDQLTINGSLYLKQNAALNIKNGSGTDVVNNGYLKLISGTLNFDSSADILNDITGTLNFETAGNLTGNGILINKDSLIIPVNIEFPAGVTFNQVAGITNGKGSLSIKGIMNEKGGDVKLPLTIEKGAVLTMNNEEPINMSDITNNGTVNWDTSDVTFYSGVVFSNNGQLNIYGTGNFYNSGKVAAILNNSTTGKIEKFANVKYTNTYIATNINNYGSIIVHASNFETGGDFHNWHILTIEESSYFETDGTFYAESGEKLSGSGNFTSYGTINIDYDDTLSRHMYFDCEGTLQGNGSLCVQGKANFFGICKIPLTIASSSTIGDFYEDLFKPFINNGTVKMGGDVCHVYDECINNGTIIINYPDYATFGKGANSAKFINNGLIKVTGGFFCTFFVDFPFTNSSTGILEGIGTFRFGNTFINEGSIIAGLKYQGQLGIFNNPFNDSSTTNIGIGKNKNGKTRADNIFVYNNFNTQVAGTLNLYQINNNEVIDTGDYIIVQNYSTFSGTFSTVNKPDNWSVVYTKYNIQVHVGPVSGFTLTKNKEDALIKDQDSKTELFYSVFPNPTQSKIIIQFNSAKSSNYNIQISDVGGNILQTKTVTATAGLNKVDIDVHSYLPGNYIINMISDDKQKRILKFIKQ